MSFRTRWPRYGRIVVTATLLAVLAPAVLVATRAIVENVAAGLGIAALVALSLTACLWRWAPRRFEGRGGALSLAVWLGLSAFAAYRLAEVAVFMGDVERDDLAYIKANRDRGEGNDSASLVPGHYCATAYVVACELASERPEDLYVSSSYGSAEGEQRTSVHDEIGETFMIDTFEYPPQFLLLAGLLMEIGGGVFGFRALFFGLEVVAFVLVVGALARWTSADRLGVVWFTLPVLLLTPDLVTTLEIGNAHFFVIVLTIGGMLALERRRYGLGGALLAFGVVGKVFPVVLLVYLAARRSWRALGFTLGWVALWSVATAFAFGVASFQAFLGGQLPQLVSGEAFEFLLSLDIVKVLNVSVPGLAAKLAFLGWTDGESQLLSVVLERGFSLFLLVALVLAGRRHGADVVEGPSGDAALSLATTWLALLVLAQLQSPLLPTVYGNLSTVWLICLLAAGARSVSPLWFVPLAFLFTLPVTLPFGPPTLKFDAAFTLLTVGVTCFLAGWVVVRRASHEALRPSTASARLP